MTDANRSASVLLIPCSGIGKVHGLISRETVFQVTDRIPSAQADAVCLALLVSGDPRTRERVQRLPCITLDGCPKLCAQKNVDAVGGKIVKAIRVYDGMKRHRGANFGTATALSEEGWLVVDELAAEVAELAIQEAKT